MVKNSLFWWKLVADLFNSMPLFPFFLVYIFKEYYMMHFDIGIHTGYVQAI